MVVCKSACAFRFDESNVTGGMRCGDCGSIESILALPGSAAHAVVILRRQVSSNHNHVGAKDLMEAWEIAARSATLVEQKFKLNAKQLRALGAAAFKTLDLPFE